MCCNLQSISAYHLFFQPSFLLSGYLTVGTFTNSGKRTLSFVHTKFVSWPIYRCTVPMILRLCKKYKKEECKRSWNFWEVSSAHGTDGLICLLCLIWSRSSLWPSLWGGSVINLGTQKHKDKFFAGIDSVDYPGCFAMTELHHGKGVRTC